MEGDCHPFVNRLIRTADPSPLPLVGLMTNKCPRPVDFRKVLRRLLLRFGPQCWWPAKTPFEVCVGAVLTQNTAWVNVERAIANLKNAGVLGCRRLRALPHSRLARLLRPSGYFNLKARRLRAFLDFFNQEFGASIHRMRKQGLYGLRGKLLNVHGVGRETADSILLYALNKPVFVVDAYTRRIFSRHNWIRGDEDYDQIRLRVETSWAKSDISLKIRDYNEFHALLVAVGKHYCHSRVPLCWKCPLQKMLPKKAG